MDLQFVDWQLRQWLFHLQILNLHFRTQMSFENQIQNLEFVRTTTFVRRPVVRKWALLQKQTALDSVRMATELLVRTIRLFPV